MCNNDNYNTFSTVALSPHDKMVPGSIPRPYTSCVEFSQCLSGFTPGTPLSPNGLIQTAR